MLQSANELYVFEMQRMDEGKTNDEMVEIDSI